MIAHRVGFGLNGYRPALPPAPKPIILPPAPGTTLGQAGSNGSNTLNVLFMVGLAALMVVFAATVISADKGD